jgi:excisionase family DNA binding protein
MKATPIMTLRELALHLKIGEKTVYTLAQRGELPGFKVGGQWRFRSLDIERWIDLQTTAPTEARPRPRSGR